jgi:hypothetical protein
VSTLELSQKIGQTVKLSTNDLMVEVVINDAKVSYGNIRYYVSPVAGNGSVWVDASRVRGN